jgi:hypothetical protein
MSRAKKRMVRFLGIEPKLKDYWRSIILFGKNVEYDVGFFVKDAEKLQ